MVNATVGRSHPDICLRALTGSSVTDDDKLREARIRSVGRAQHYLKRSTAPSLAGTLVTWITRKDHQ